MAVTYGTPVITSIGARYRSETVIGLDSSYPTGGYLLNPIYLKLISIEQLNATANEGGFIFDWITSTGKLKVLAAAGGSLTVSGTNLSSAVTGTAAGQVFAGSALGTHSHNLQQINGETIAVDPASGTSAAAASPPIANVESVYVNTPAIALANKTLEVVPGGKVAATGQVSYNPTTGVFQTLLADGIDSITVQYLTRPVTSTSAGTPAGTNAVSALTATAAAQVWSGSVAGAASFAEVAPGTNLSALNALQITAIGQ